MTEKVKEAIARLGNVVSAYKYDSELWPVNEICYALTGILKEIDENGEELSEQYIEEKLLTIRQLLEGCKKANIGDYLGKHGVLSI